MRECIITGNMCHIQFNGCQGTMKKAGIVKCKQKWVNDNNFGMSDSDSGA